MTPPKSTDHNTESDPVAPPPGGGREDTLDSTEETSDPVAPPPGGGREDGEDTSSGGGSNSR